MILPPGYASESAYMDALSSFLNSEFVLLLTAQIHHLDILPRPGAVGDWASVPAVWRAWFDSVASPEELQAKLNDVRSDRQLAGRPATLTAFLDATRALCLPRQVTQSATSPTAAPARDVLRLGPMSVKKVHEVEQFADLVGRIATERGVRKIIDIGAGQGYLTRTLATLHPSFTFLAVDGSAAQLAGSQRMSPDLASQITYLPAFIRSSRSAQAEIEAWLGADDALVIGLHCCGCLTDDILGMFTQTERIRGAVVAGCCFNHLRTSSTGAEAEAAVFPTSVRVRQSGVALGSTALMAACQDMSNWARVDETPALASRRQLVRKKMHYRRLLTALLASPGMPPTPKHLPLGAVALALTETFPTYAERSLTKLGLLARIDAGAALETARELEDAYGDWRWEGRGRVVEALAKACGGAVESMIALDRFWALNEIMGVRADVVVAWDYAVSPRNLVVVAGKD